MTETYQLNENSLPVMPCPHDCGIREIRLEGRELAFIFEDDISRHESIRYLKPEARSLVIRYHLACDPEDDFLCRVSAAKVRTGKGSYQFLDSGKVTGIVPAGSVLDYIDHYVTSLGSCMRIVIIIAGGEEYLISAYVDSVEYEWIL